MNPHDEFNTDGVLGYLISFRCYGTWLHGDKVWLWTETELSNAIDYVLYEQGDPLP
ncbi:MAG TPA: hypothetical protein VLA93_14760 [Pyrinomonadaceae bacterium]|nr:hypothetical protein [Pyrinomonadaceae bacterium]